MQKHTPGPWRVAPPSDYPQDPRLHVDAWTRGYVALCGVRDDLEAQANARLIAKAWVIPELAEALRDTLRALESHLTKEAQEAGVSCYRLCPCMTDEVQRARAALAKIEG